MSKYTLTRAFRGIRRWHSDPEYRKKKLDERRRYQRKPEVKKRMRERAREKTRLLNEFSNKRCVKCGKLISYKAKTSYCINDYRKLPPKIKKELKIKYNKNECNQSYRNRTRKI